MSSLKTARARAGEPVVTLESGALAPPTAEATALDEPPPLARNDRRRGDGDVRPDKTSSSVAGVGVARPITSLTLCDCAKYIDAGDGIVVGPGGEKNGGLAVVGVCA